MISEVVISFMRLSGEVIVVVSDDVVEDGVMFVSVSIIGKVVVRMIMCMVCIIVIFGRLVLCLMVRIVICDSVLGLLVRKVEVWF